MKIKNILFVSLYKDGKRNDAICEKTEKMKKRLLEKGAKIVHHWNGHIEYLHNGFVWVFNYEDHWKTGVPCCYIGVKRWE